MRRSGIWDEVRALRDKDDVPRVELMPGARIIERRPPGRPRKNPLGDRFAHWKMKTPSGFPLRCRNFGCNKALRKDDVDICCSEACRGLLRRFCEDTLDVLDGREEPIRYPAYWRSDRSGTRSRHARADR
jgi:hypothetical protein